MKEENIPPNSISFPQSTENKNSCQIYQEDCERFVEKQMNIFEQQQQLQTANPRLTSVYLNY